MSKVELLSSGSIGREEKYVIIIEIIVWRSDIAVIWLSQTESISSPRKGSRRGGTGACIE
jgi:hypothetical protein